MVLYNYVLVKKAGKDAIDVREWEAPITQSIKSIIPTASNIVAVKDGYSFENTEPLTHGKLRSIGKEIASNCKGLFELAGRTYDYYSYGDYEIKRSKQLFVKRK